VAITCFSNSAPFIGFDAAQIVGFNVVSFVGYCVEHQIGFSAQRCFSGQNTRHPTQSTVETELANVPDEAVRKAIDQTRHVGWPKSQAALDANSVNLLTMELHHGEAEAIALAL
jgi:hypothetical protein